MILIYYSKCSTCVKSKKWLENNNIKFKLRDISISIPSYEEIDNWVVKHNVDINKFFNRNGVVYRENKLKDKLNLMPYEEKIKLLSSNFKLIKRPIIVSDKVILFGFNELDWGNALL